LENMVSHMDENKKCDLSVIVVSRNVVDLTRQCLASIYENTKEIAFEVILVDNGSTDGSPEMVEREFPKVRLIRNAVGRGLARANNQGLEISKGRYLLTLNSDTVVQPGALDRLVQFMDEHPDAGGATPKLVLPGGHPHPVFCGKIPTLKSELLDAMSALHTRIADALPAVRYETNMDFEKTQQVPCILWGTALVVRREAYESIGNQDPRFFVYCEDVDWSMRLVKAGWKLYYVADAVVVHYGGQSTKQTSVEMHAQLIRSKCRLIQKHYGLAAGLALRATTALVCAIRLLKWLVLYAVLPRVRLKAKSRINEMWATICAAVRY